MDQPCGAQVAFPVLAGIPLVHLAPDFQSQSLLVLGIFHEAMNPPEDVLHWRVFEPYAWPRDIDDSHFALDAGPDELKAELDSCWLMSLVLRRLVKWSYSLLIMLNAIQNDLQGLRGADDAYDPHLSEPAPTCCVGSQMMKALHPLHTVVKTDLEGDVELVVHNEVLAVHSNSEFRHPFLVPQERMRALEALMAERSDVFFHEQGAFCYETVDLRRYFFSAFVPLFAFNDDEATGESAWTDWTSGTAI